MHNLSGIKTKICISTLVQLKQNKTKQNKFYFSKLIPKGSPGKGAEGDGLEMSSSEPKIIIHNFHSSLVT